jgi:hypothetical protein
MLAVDEGALPFQDGRTVDVRGDSDCLREPFWWNLAGRARRLRASRTRLCGPARSEPTRAGVLQRPR